MHSETNGLSFQVEE